MNWETSSRRSSPGHGPPRTIGYGLGSSGRALRISSRRAVARAWARWDEVGRVCGLAAASQACGASPNPSQACEFAADGQSCGRGHFLESGVVSANEYCVTSALTTLSSALSGVVTTSAADCPGNAGLRNGKRRVSRAPARCRLQGLWTSIAVSSVLMTSPLWVRRRRLTLF